jgi:hypothetical protein
MSLMSTFNYSKKIRTKLDSNWYKNLTKDQQNEVKDRIKTVIQQKLRLRIEELKKTASINPDLVDELVVKIVDELEPHIPPEKLGLLEDLVEQTKWCSDK